MGKLYAVGKMCKICKQLFTDETARDAVFVGNKESDGLAHIQCYYSDKLETSKTVDKE